MERTKGLARRLKAPLESRERLEQELANLDARVEEYLKKLIEGELDDALTKSTRRGLMDGLIESMQRRTMQRAKIKRASRASR